MAHMNGGRGIDWPMATRVALSSLSLLGATGKLTATGTEPLHALGLGLSAVLLLGVAQVACAVGVLFAGQARRAAAVALVIGLVGTAALSRLDLYLTLVSLLFPVLAVAVLVRPGDRGLRVRRRGTVEPQELYVELGPVDVVVTERRRPLGPRRPLPSPHPPEQEPLPKWAEGLIATLEEQDEPPIDR